MRTSENLHQKRPWRISRLADLSHQKSAIFGKENELSDMKTRRWILMEARVLVQLDVGTSHMQPSRWGGLDLGEYTGTPKKKSYAWQFLSDWNRKRPFWKSSSPQKSKMRTKRFQLFGSGFSVDYSIFFNFQDLDAVLIVFRCSISISIWFWLMRFLEHRLSSLESKKAGTWTWTLFVLMLCSWFFLIDKLMGSIYIYIIYLHL